jgi:hypothetical protein
LGDKKHCEKEDHGQWGVRYPLLEAHLFHSWRTKQRNNMNRLLEIICIFSYLFVFCDSSRVPGETALWEFDREDCFAGVFPNNATKGRFGSLIRNSTTSTRCLYGRGVKAKSGLPTTTGLLIESTRTMQQLISANPAGISIELWANFGANANEANTIMPIFTIGQGNSSNSQFCYPNDVADMSMNLLIGSYNQKLYLTFVDIYGNTVVSSGTYTSSRGCDQSL